MPPPPITKISVHKIVDLILRCGDIDSRFSESSTMYRGAAAHRKIQKEAGAGYIKEVQLKLETEIEGIPMRIQGRADGIITADDGTITIDEIKTTTLPLNYLYKQHEQHLGQGKCYAYMYLTILATPPPAITVQLTYYQLDSEVLERHRWEFTPTELEAFFTDLLRQYGLWLRFERDWKIERNDSILAASFPFESFRSGQREFAAAAYRAITAQKKLYAAAPTGIGKTLSALFPAIKAMGEGKAEKLFYLTAKTITRTVAEDAVKLMTHQGLRFKSVTLRAKDKICPNDVCICSPDACINAKGHYDRLNDALWDLLHSVDLITPDITAQFAQKHHVCPHEFALDTALWCDLVIGDYNHVFDPSVYLRRFFNNNDNRDYVFLIDEAHNLADRVRDMYTASLRKSTFSSVRTQLKDKDPQSAEVRKTLKQINAYLTDMRNEMHKNAPTAHAVTSPTAEPLRSNFPAYGKSLAVEAQDFVFKAFVTLFSQATGEWLAAKKYDNHALYNALLNLYFEVNMYMLVSELYDSHYTTLIETHGSDVAVTLFCLDPSQVIAEGLSRGISSIIFSATLTPLNYYREILGGSDEDTIISLPSPFDPKRQQIIIHRGISTKYIHRENSYAPIAETIYTAISQRKGNYLVFFPSYDYMNKVYAIFHENYPHINTLLQQGHMTETERLDFLEQFSENNTETLVGFTVLGGIFSEGIDLKGDRLIGSIIISVGIPMINMRQDQIRDYFNRKNNQGYDYAYVYPGMNKVLQAAGRVIRTETDSGIVLLIDDRFATEKYWGMFPAHWSNVRVISDICGCHK